MCLPRRFHCWQERAKTDCDAGARLGDATLPPSNPPSPQLAATVVAACAVFTPAGCGAVLGVPQPGHARSWVEARPRRETLAPNGHQRLQMLVSIRRCIDQPTSGQSAGVGVEGRGIASTPAAGPNIDPLPTRGLGASQRKARTRFHSRCQPAPLPALRRVDPLSARTPHCTASRTAEKGTASHPLLSTPPAPVAGPCQSQGQG